MFPTIENIKDNQEMISAINYPLNKNLVVVGHPGTGKTVIAINRFAKLYKQGLNVALICYNVLLRNFILEILDKKFNLGGKEIEKKVRTIDSFFGSLKYKLRGEINKKDSKYLSSMNIDEINTFFDEIYKQFGKYYDEIIVDEGQDMSLEIILNLSKITKHMTVLMDELQFVKNYFPNHAKLDSEILEEEYNFDIIELTKNYRTPENIYNFAIQQFVKDNEKLIYTQSINTGEGKYVIERDLVEEEIIEKIQDIYQKKKGLSIGILLHTKEEVDKYYDKFKELGENIFKYHSSLSNKNMLKLNNGLTITTYKSSKGLEFDIVIVVIKKDFANESNVNQQLFVLSTRAKHEIFYFFLK